jgi:hypothetical protein
MVANEATDEWPYGKSVPAYRQNYCACISKPMQRIPACVSPLLASSERVDGVLQI